VKKLKVGVIGCGSIANGAHIPSYMANPTCEIKYFCDLIPEKAEGFAAKTGSGKAFTDYRVMLDEIAPDAVFVCVPPNCHGAIEDDLIRRRIPFFVEKPLSVDLAQAREIGRRVEEAGLITAVGFQCRYDMLAAPVRAFVRNNEVIYINCTRFGGVPDMPWWRVKSMSGGQLAEQTIHQLDYIRYAYGEPETVFSMAARGYIKEFENYDTDDVSVTVVRFRSGALATIATGCYALSGEAFDSKTTYSTRKKRLDMYLLDRADIYGEAPGEETSAVGDLVVKGDGSLSAANGGAISVKHTGDPGLLCDRTFLEAVVSGDGSKIRSPYADALKTLEFAMACNKSMDTGLPVRVGE
jgi:predicted dehydrogenase